MPPGKDTGVFTAPWAEQPERTGLAEEAEEVEEGRLCVSCSWQANADTGLPIRL